MRRRSRWPGPAWFARLGVRGRSVLAAIVVVVVAMLLGGTGLVFALASTLDRAGEAAARARVAEVVARVDADGLPATAAGLPAEARTDAVTLVFAADGHLVGTSRRATTTPLSAQRPPVGAYESVKLDVDTLDVGGEWQVVTTALTSDGATYYVQVAQSVLVQRSILQTTTLLLLAGAPFLVAAAALAVWLLVGRALRAVEEIRSAVAEISPRELATRVDVPPTGDEIAALAATMNAMLDRLEIADAAQRAFVSDASHELSSPVSTLTTAAELAVGTTDEATRTRLLVTMDAELVRVRGLVANLRALARLDAPGAGPVVADVDLDDLVDAEVQRLRFTSRHDVHARVEPVRVRADASGVAQALRNLVDNADRHAVSRIVLTLAKRTGDAVVWVDNDGPVIDVADRARVFERFVRLDASRSRDAGGSGLGLAIARASLTVQGGDVTVVEHPDGWCRFEIRLPLPRE